MKYRARFPRLAAIGLALALGSLAMAAELANTSNKALIKTHAKLEKNYKQVSHITAQRLSEMDDDSYLVFDVREADEFAVSHLEGAIWVDPDMNPDAFYSAYGAQASGKMIVLYCSVGVRSTRLAQRLLSTQSGEDAAPIYNLENGIFGWHNESRPLSAQNGATDFVHPYNRLWGRMVNRKDLRRYETQARSHE